MKLLEFIPEGTEDCTVTAWIHGSEAFPNLAPYAYPRPAMVICPGGGYAGLSEQEAEPAAKAYFSAGYNTFILRYAVGEKAGGLLPLCQLAATVLHVRNHGKEWNTDGNKVAVCGFSAGGHLACSLGTLFNEEPFRKVFAREGNIRPDAMVLCYPVITSDEFAHVDSIRMVSGAPEGADTYRWFGLDRHVDRQTPPTFLWHTAADDVVPVENSLKFAMALSAEKIPCELHILPEGPHGMSVCKAEVNTPSEYNGRWLQWSIAWLNKTLRFVP